MGVEINNGPPLKFKAVNTETGESSEPFELMPEGGFVFGIDPIVIRELGDELCQSTGLKDANSDEIYFSNVLLSLVDDEVYTVVWDEVDCECRLVTKEDSIAYINNDSSLSFRVIGNRYQSREQLEAKAKEIK